MIDAAPDSVGFPRLDDGQLAVVDGLGQRRRVEVGEILFSPADAAYDWIVLVTASADIVGANGETIVRHGQRGFLGEVSLVTRQRPYLTARVVTSGDVIVVPAEVFRSRVLSDVRLSDTVLEAFIVRRAALLDSAADTMQIVGSVHTPASMALREFATRNRIRAGPSGLAASVYAASEGLRTLTLDATAIGGQAASSSRIENYLGFPTGISGQDLASRAAMQALKFGAVITSPCAVTGLALVAGHHTLDLADGSQIAGRAVVAATGAHYRRLPVTNLDQYEMAGVYYAATDIEARACRGAPVLVVGGGNSAGQAAMFLAEHATSVCIAVRRPLAATMSSYLVDRIEAHPRIAVHEDTTVSALAGAPTLQSATLSSGEQTVTVDCTALFSFIGAEPNSGWLGDVATDEHGFVRTDHALRAADLDEGWTTLGRPPLPFETSRPGLFAVGDLRAGSTKRVAGAVGEGSAAIRSVHQYLDHRH